MSAPMVRAILNGSKTQTRRICNPQPALGFLQRGVVAAVPQWPIQEGIRWFMKDGFSQLVPCPFKPAMRLWVKETFQTCEKCGSLNYRATVNKPKNCAGCDEYLAKWKPSIFMPRVASRITLDITGVSVQRLQEISEEDALEEGVEFHPKSKQFFKLYNCKDGISTTAKQSFYSLWMSIHGADSWDKNEWVWKISFKNL